jgi:hypothetical protein
VLQGYPGNNPDPLPLHFDTSDICPTGLGMAIRLGSRRMRPVEILPIQKAQGHTLQTSGYGWARSRWSLLVDSLTAQGGLLDPTSPSDAVVRRFMTDAGHRGHQKVTQKNHHLCGKMARCKLSSFAINIATINKKAVDGGRWTGPEIQEHQ